MPATRAIVPAFAKLNLSLLVLGKRSDGYHELRTVFQTISLHDTLAIEYAAARRTVIEVASNIDIPGNLVIGAARLVLDAMRASARVRFTLTKRIPMGGGLGGGSSDAAAVLLALPPLARRAVPFERLSVIAAELGSDVPFFLHGGTALGLGRGHELYPLPPARARHVLIHVPPVAVQTTEAYRALERGPLEQLTLPDCSNRMKKFQSLVECLGYPEARCDWTAFCENDFEAVVFRHHPSLRSLRNKLLRAGAGLVRMTGSGSALFGVFPSRPAVERACAALQGGRELVEPVSFIGRRQYRAAWCRALGPLAGPVPAGPVMDKGKWPPQGL